jgi:hypothetical protein
MGADAGTNRLVGPGIQTGLCQNPGGLLSANSGMTKLTSGLGFLFPPDVVQQGGQFQNPEIGPFLAPDLLGQMEHPLDMIPPVAGPDSFQADLGYLADLFFN